MKQMNGKTWKRRTLSLVLALMVSVSSFAPAFAEGEAPAEGMESSNMSAETFEPGSAGTSEEGGSSGTESGSTEGAPVSGGDKNESTDGQAPGEETSEPAPGEGNGGLAPGEDGDKDDPASGEGEGETGTGTASGEEEEPPALDGDGSAGTSAPDAGESIPAEGCPTEGCTLPAGHEGECVVSNGAILAAEQGDGFTWDEESKTLTITDLNAKGWDTYADKAVYLIIDDPDGDIPDSAFAFQASNEVLKVIDIKNCGDIGKNAFHQNTGNIGNTYTSVKIGTCGDIGSNAFTSNTRATLLETVEIGKCGTIGSSAFSNQQYLTSVTIEECSSIGNQAFSGTTALEYLTIGSCESIGEYAFAFGCGAPIKMLTLDGCTVGDSSFYNAKIEKLTLINSANIAEGAFASANITELTLDNITKLGKNAFQGNGELTTLTIRNVPRIEEGTFELYDGQTNKVKTINLSNIKYIGNYAFKGFTEVTEIVIDETCEYIGAHAFSGCESLKSIVIPEKTRLGYSDVFNRFDLIRNRVTAILSGKHPIVWETLNDLNALAPDGWTSTQVGKQNTTTGGGATQLTKEAKWANDERTIADVQIKASFAAERQMDFIFVADCSNSMAGFGSDDAMNSNFYNMQSKIMDVTNQLLGTSDEELDTRVAFVTFGETDASALGFYGKDQLTEAENDIWDKIINYYSNTNYAAGLKMVPGLVKECQDANRKVTIIFISDGQPYGPGDEIPLAYYGVAEAEAIRKMGVDILAVLQQVPESEQAESLENMLKLTGDKDKIFLSDDLNGFSQAVNDAVELAYKDYTLIDTVHPDFLLDKESLKVQKLVDGALVDAPEVTAAASGNVITWNLGAGDPFTTYILTFQQTLKPENQHEGDFDTNAGDAPLTIGGKAVNNVATPVLPRPGSSNPGSGGGDDPDYDDITVTKVDEDGNTIARVASFIVYKKSGGDILYKTVSGGWTEDRDEAWKYYTRDGRFTVYDLKPGTYYIEEIKAPDGYALAEEPLKVEVDGRDVKVQFENEAAKKPATPKPIPDTGR